MAFSNQPRFLTESKRNSKANLGNMKEKYWDQRIRDQLRQNKRYAEILTNTHIYF